MAFTIFPKLPTELRDRIWSYAAGEDEARTVEVVFQGTPYYQPASFRRNTNRPPKQTSVQYRYRCLSGSAPPGSLSACHESRVKFLRLNPDHLQLNRGPRIYFNATKDIIFMGLESLFHLRYYTSSRRAQVVKNLYGFNRITKLSMPVRTDYPMVRALRKNSFPGFNRRPPPPPSVAGFPILSALKTKSVEKSEFRGIVKTSSSLKASLVEKLVGLQRRNFTTLQKIVVQKEIYHVDSNVNSEMGD